MTVDVTTRVNAENNILAELDNLLGTDFTRITGPSALLGAGNLSGIYIYFDFAQAEIMLNNELVSTARVSIDRKAISIEDREAFAKRIFSLLSEIQPCNFIEDTLIKALVNQDSLDITDSKTVKGTWHLELITSTRPVPEYYEEHYNRLHEQREAREKGEDLDIAKLMDRTSFADPIKQKERKNKVFEKMIDILVESNGGGWVNEPALYMALYYEFLGKYGINSETVGDFTALTDGEVSQQITFATDRVVIFNAVETRVLPDEGNLRSALVDVYEKMTEIGAKFVFDGLYDRLKENGSVTVTLADDDSFELVESV